MQLSKPTKPKLNDFQKAEEIIQSLPSSYHYFKVYPYNSLSSKNTTAPFVLVYKYTDSLTFGNLQEKYARDKKQSIIPRFSLKNRQVLQHQCTLKQKRKELRYPTLNGLEIYAQMLTSYDECEKKIQKMQSLKFTGCIKVPFELTDLKYIIYIPISDERNESFQIVVDKLLKEIQRIFGPIVTPNMIRLSVNYSQGIKRGKEINLNSLSSEDKVMVGFANGFKIKAPARLNNSYVTIKGEELKIKPTKLHYDDIKDKMVKDVLGLIDDDIVWSEYGIMVEGHFLKSEETFSKADSLLQNTGSVFKNVAAVIIKESLLFEAEQDNIKKIGGQVFIQTISHSHPENQKHRELCIKTAGIRAQKINLSHFKNKLEFVKPILWYTSNLLVVPSNNGSISTLYSNVNNFLRTQQFGKTTEVDYKDKWEYPFSSELIEQLKNIDPISDTTIWRGINYPQQHQVGEKVLYKQFLSCSTNKVKASSFAEKGLIKIVKSISGKLIKDFSLYVDEEEVLFEPYSEFRVVSVSTIQIEDGWISRTIPFIEMEELPRLSMPQNKSVILLWVDDKTIEAKQIWDTIEDIKKTTVMKQLLSTKQLKDWLNANDDLVNDPFTKIVMVTNMTREEKVGTQNPFAGIQAIKQFRQKIPKGPICLYIWKLQYALEKLRNHNLNRSDTLWVTNEVWMLQLFLQGASGLH